MSDDVDIQFGASTDGIEAGADRTKEKIHEVSDEVEHAEELFKYLAERMAEVFALHEIAEFVEHMTELGEQALRSSAMLGMTVEQVQELAYAAQLAGTDAESFTQSMIRFERNIAEAQKGAGNAAEAFHNLGISQQELKEKSPTELLYRVADAFHDTEDGATKVQYAVELGGRSWAQMIPLLDRGSAAIRDAGEEAKKTASVMTTEQAEALEHTHQEITRMEANWRGFGLTLMSVVGPAIDELVNAFGTIATVMTDTINYLRELQIVLSADLVIAVGRFWMAVQDTTAEVLMAVDKMLIRWKELGAVMSAAATGNFGLIKDIMAEADAQSEAAAKKAEASLKEHGQAYEKLKEDAVKAMNEILAKRRELAESEGKNKPALPPLQGGFGKKDDTERQLDQEDIRFQEQMGKLEIANRKSVLDEKVAMGEISKKEEYDQLQKLLDDEYALEAGAIQQALQLDGLTVVEKQKLDDQLLLLHQKYLNDKEAMTRKSLDEDKKQFDQVFQGINRAFTQSINGILQGTQTWQQAMSRIFTGILSVFVDMAEKMASKWLENMLLQEIYGKEQATATITTDAAQAGAGAYAATAAIPIVGPELAPAAAAKAYGETLAFQGLASFDIGAWELPSDQIARVHQGEMIIPKPFADSVRENGGLGGGDVHLHVHAIDGASVKRLFMDNGATLAAALKQQMRNFNPNTSVT